MNRDLLFDTQVSTSMLTTVCVCPVQKRFEEDLKRIWTRAGLKKAPEGWTTPKIFIKQHGNKDWETTWIELTCVTSHSHWTALLTTLKWSMFPYVYNNFWQSVHNLIKIFLCGTQGMVCCFFFPFFICWLEVSLEHLHFSCSYCGWQYCAK